MIERKFIIENLREFEIKEYIRTNLRKAGISDVTLQKTPLGEKIIIKTPRPGLVVGRRGQNIRTLTEELKKRFKLENPKIEIQEVEDVNLDPVIVAEKIANSLERYGTTRFKAIGHKALDGVMRAGARGVEILISGKIPSTRARTWRFYAGYMKKSGEFNKVGILKAYAIAKLKTGIVGIQVRIMPPDVQLPDALIVGTPQEQKEVPQEPEVVIEEVTTEKKEEKTEKKTTKKKTSKKTTSRTTTKSKKSAAKKTDTQKVTDAEQDTSKKTEDNAKKDTKKAQSSPSSSEETPSGDQA